MAEPREWTGEGELPEGVTDPPLVSREYRRLQNAYADEQACKEVAEERCAILQREVVELREQLNMFSAAAQLGVLVVSHPTEGASGASTTVMTDSTETMSDSTETMSDSAAVMSDSAEAMTDSAEAVTDFAEAMTDSAVDMSDSAVVKDPTAVSDSAAVGSDSAAVGSDSAAVGSDSAAVASDSAAVASDPEAVASDPEAVASDPEAVASDPEAVASDPEAVASDPEAVASDPEAVASDPEAVASDPEAVASDPEAVASDPEAVTSEPTLTSEELVDSLKLQLIRVLESNRMKSIEILQRLEEIRSVRQDLNMTRTLMDRLNKLCDDLQVAVTMMGRHKEDVENIRRQMNALENENGCYRDALNEVKASLKEVKGEKTKQDELVANLIQYILNLNESAEIEKRHAVEICKYTMREQFIQDTDKQKQELDAAKAEVDKMKLLYSKLCVETSVKDAQLKAKTMALLENRLLVLLDMQRKQMARALEEHQDVPKEGAESELAGAYRKCGEMMLDAKLNSYEEQSKVTQKMLEEIRRDVEEMWQTECGIPDLDVEQDAGQHSREAGAHGGK